MSTATSTKPALLITQALLAKHFAAFRARNMPLAIDTHKALKKQLEALYPKRAINESGISIFLAQWTSRPAYRAALAASRAADPNGKAQRYSIFGNAVVHWDARKEQAATKRSAPSKPAKTAPQEMPPEKPRAEFDLNDLSFRGRPILKLRKP